MKLRNKKTGEIGELLPWVDYKTKKEVKEFAVMLDNRKEPLSYGSLAKLNEEWEDVPEEPEEYWYIDYDGGVLRRETDGSAAEKMMISVGNHFESMEEAEQAVRRLKAWKRLKNGGFVFCGRGDCLDTIKFDYGPAGYNNQDFALLFGGEE